MSLVHDAEGTTPSKRPWNQIQRQRQQQQQQQQQQLHRLASKCYIRQHAAPLFHPLEATSIKDKYVHKHIHNTTLPNTHHVDDISDLKAGLW